MTHAKFNHQECRPALIHPDIGRLPEEHPVMATILKVWDEMPLAGRVAWHNVCCNNSRDPHDLELCQDLIQQVQVASASLTVH